MLSDHDREQYRDQGFLLKAGLLSDAECDGLCAYISATIRRLATETPCQDPGEEYFRRSARATRLFWEKEADPSSLPPAERERCVSRLGHGLHWVDPLFRDAARHPAVAEALEALNGPGLQIVQSMVLYKQPHIGGEIGCHQDAAFLHTEPNTLLAAWMALDEVTEENSPLVVIPGSHHLPLRTRAEMGEDGRFRHHALADEAPDPAAAVPVPAPRGSVIFFHGLLHHGSGPNRSPRPRRAYAVHYTSAASRWSPFNWIDGAPGFVPLREA